MFTDSCDGATHYATYNADVAGGSWIWAFPGIGYLLASPGVSHALPTVGSWALNGNSDCTTTVTLSVCSPSATPRPSSAALTAITYGSSSCNSSTALVAVTYPSGTCMPSGSALGTYDFISCNGGFVTVYKGYAGATCSGSYQYSSVEHPGACAPAGTAEGLPVVTLASFTEPNCRGDVVTQTMRSGACAGNTMLNCSAGYVTATLFSPTCGGSQQGQTSYYTDYCSSGEYAFDKTPSIRLSCPTVSSTSFACSSSPCGPTCVACSPLTGWCSECSGGLISQHGVCVVPPSGTMTSTMSPTMTPSKSSGLNEHGCPGLCTYCQISGDNGGLTRRLGGREMNAAATFFCYACPPNYALMNYIGPNTCVFVGTPTPSASLSTGATPTSTGTQTSTQSATPTTTPLRGCFQAACTGCQSCYSDRTCYQCDAGFVPMIKSYVSILASQCAGTLCINASNPHSGSGAYRNCLAVDTNGYCTVCASGRDCSYVVQPSPSISPSMTATLSSGASASATSAATLSSTVTLTISPTQSATATMSRSAQPTYACPASACVGCQSSCEPDSTCESVCDAGFVHVFSTVIYDGCVGASALLLRLACASRSYRQARIARHERVTIPDSLVARCVLAPIYRPCGCHIWMSDSIPRSFLASLQDTAFAWWTRTLDSRTRLSWPHTCSAGLLMHLGTAQVAQMRHVCSLSRARRLRLFHEVQVPVRRCR